MNKGSGAAAAADVREGSTHLRRAFNVYRNLHPNPVSPGDLAERLGVEAACAYDYVKRLKALGCIERTAGTDARPLHGLTAAAIEGTAEPPPDGRGRHPRQVLAAWTGGGRR